MRRQPWGGLGVQVFFCERLRGVLILVLLGLVVAVGEMVGVSVLDFVAAVSVRGVAVPSVAVRVAVLSPKVGVREGVGEGRKGWDVEVGVAVRVGAGTTRVWRGGVSANASGVVCVCPPSLGKE